MIESNASWKKYVLELIIIFVGISLAFALENWNENRKDRLSEFKILTEIKNGLQLDLVDLSSNKEGHEKGIVACRYLKSILNNDPYDKKLINSSFYIIFRDFISVQNKTGYETLRSTGLELIKNDSLRYNIIKLYDYNYEIVEKLEENYAEIQFFQNYFKLFSELLIDEMVIDKEGNLIDFKRPITLSKKNKNTLLLYLNKIQSNRFFITQLYADTEKSIENLIEQIEKEIH